VIVVKDGEAAGGDEAIEVDEKDDDDDDDDEDEDEADSNVGEEDTDAA
jgi:hypothetical protein